MGSPSISSSSHLPYRWLRLATLVLAGESIFFLPFVIARVFRPTLLEVFGITNLQLGVAYSTYGIVAMLSYLLGGPLADRFDARRLMTLALLATSAGGVVLATIPSAGVLLGLYAFWGGSTILVFWAALIRATRQWGGDTLQGSAFGLLDGGRGFVAAAIGSVAVFCYAWLLPEPRAELSLDDRTRAFQQVILLFTAITFLSAALVWFALPNRESRTPATSWRATVRGLCDAGATPIVWFQSLIIICAYVAYKGLDDVSLYARDVLNVDEVTAAYAGTVSMWIRPLGAISAGVIADRIRVTTMTFVSFLALLMGSLVIATGMLHGGMLVPFFITIVATSAAVFALRGLYFAIMGEGHIPFRYMGSAVGIVSVIGYTPDIFMGPLMGILLDRSPGALGHQHVFSVIAAFSFIGMLATLWFRRLAKRHVANRDQSVFGDEPVS